MRFLFGYNDARLRHANGEIVVAHMNDGSRYVVNRFLSKERIETMAGRSAYWRGFVSFTSPKEAYEYLISQDQQAA